MAGRRSPRGRVNEALPDPNHLWIILYHNPSTGLASFFCRRLSLKWSSSDGSRGKPWGERTFYLGPYSVNKKLLSYYTRRSVRAHAPTLTGAEITEKIN
jgi:hypothetical protein